jgi:hypothetical protein
MRAIDFPHKVTTREVISKEKKLALQILIQENKCVYKSEKQIYTLTFQELGSIFKLRECAQSIFRIKLSLYGSFLGFLKKKIRVENT